MVCLAFTAVLAAAMAVWPASVPELIQEQEGRTVLVKGSVYQKEITNDKSVIYLDDAVMTADSVHSFPNQSNQAGQAIQLQQEEQITIGRVMCALRKSADASVTMPEIGSSVVLRGRVSMWRAASNPGEFDVREYYTLSGISCSIQEAELIGKSAEYSIVSERLYQLRRRCAAVYEACMEPGEAPVMKAMVLGEKQGLNADLKKLYQNAGIAHILAISGLHISLIGMGIYRGLRRLGCPNIAAAGAGMLLLMLYAVMTGMSASAFRALCMFAMQLLADVTGRTYDMLTALALSAFLLLAGKPDSLKLTGVWFSFGAILGIACIMPAVQELCPKRCPKRLWSALSASLGVFLFTLPVQLMAYYSVNFYSVILNLLVLPCMTVLLYAGVAGLLVGLVSLPAGSMILKVCHAFLLLYEKSSRLMLLMPGASYIAGSPPVWRIVAYYMLLLPAAYAVRKGKIREHRRKPCMHVKSSDSGALWRQKQHLLSAACMTAAVLLLLLPQSDSMKIAVLDVGQGDGIVIQSETGHTYLIDGGSGSNTKLAQYRLLPYLKYHGIDTIDCAFLSHLDKDHYNGVAELLSSGGEEGVTVRRVILSAAELHDEAYTELCTLAEDSGTEIAYMQSGDDMTDGKLQIRCLYPTYDISVSNKEADRNETSLVLSVTYEGFRGLFMGDLPIEKETDVIRALAEDTATYGCTLLKAGHHGSKNSSGEELLRALHPDITVISCGAHNRYGHPHAETIERLAACGTKIYMTPETGAVTIAINGKRMKVYTVF